MELSFDHRAVLLAEDSPDDAALMKQAWKSAGLQNPLYIVSDGEEALAYLNGEDRYADRTEFPFPIAMFLDLKLPRLDGLEVLAAIRSNPGLKHLSVDILSASTRTSDVETALGLGANSYLVKPSRFESLVAMLKAWKHLGQCRMFVAPPLRKAINPDQR